MFLDFYKLREQPFGETPDPRYIYLSPTHREAIASLAYGIKTGRGFLALVSEPGMGKTTVLFHLLECLRESASTAFLFQTQCNSRDLLCYLLADLGIDTHGRELAWIHEQLNKLLIREASIGRRVVVFIDEAHNLSESALETVRLLSDFETPRSKLIQIVIAGQLELGDKLERPELAQLRQRVSSLTRLSPLTRFETEAYISHRLSKAGFKGAPLFTPEASARIAEWSRGVPRAINNLCFNALSLGYAMGKAVVDSSVVLEAARDLDPQRVSVGLVSPAVASASELSVASAEQEFSSANYVAPQRKGFEAVVISTDLGRKEQESPNARVLPLPEPANHSPKLTGRLVEGSPAVTSERDAGLLAIKESLAKKSNTAELQNVPFSGWANDGGRVKVKTLEALLIKMPRVHADISKPTLRRERKEPVTQAQAVGTAQNGDQQLQKESLAKSPVPVDLQTNVPIQDCAKKGSSVQHRERQLEKIAEPSALGTIGVTKTTSAEADVEEPNPVLFAAPSPGFRTEKNAPTTIEQAVHAPKFPASPAAAPQQADDMAQTLRTSFAHSELRQVRAPLLAVDRGVLRRWILASVVIFLLIVSLAAARWIYTSPIFDKIASTSDLREMIAGVFSSRNGSQTGAAGAVAHSNADQQLRQEKEKRQNDEMRPDGPTVHRPRERFNAQKRKGLSQVSTAVKTPSALGETNQVSETQPTGPTQQQVGAQVGHVSLQPAANLPEKIILPPYPAVAWQKNVHGRVTLKALISKDGRLRNIRLVGRPSLFSGSVLGAVKKWRYQPRMENGMPVEVETQIAIDFEK